MRRSYQSLFNEQPALGKMRLIIGTFLILLVCIGVLRAPEGYSSELPREAFWANKVDQTPDFDVVLGGDSRVLCDLSPKEMASVLPLRILNFGFNFAGYDKEYLAGVRGKLDHESRNKVIVLGITPRSLTPGNVAISGYSEEMSRGKFEKWFYLHLGSVVEMFRPEMPSTIAWWAQGRSSEKNFFKDGYMSVRVSPPSEQAEVRTYSTVFIGNTVSKQNILELQASVRRWREEGIVVFGFRPPVSQAVFAAEQRYSGFEEKEFVKSFQAAGGTWLDLKPAALVFADGSHIASSDVPGFSWTLAREIGKRLYGQTRNEENKKASKAQRS